MAGSPIKLKFNLFPPSPLTVNLANRSTSPNRNRLPSCKLNNLSTKLLFKVLFGPSYTTRAAATIAIAPPFAFSNANSPAEVASASKRENSHDAVNHIDKRGDDRFTTSAEVNKFSDDQEVVPLCPV